MQPQVKSKLTAEQERIRDLCMPVFDKILEIRSNSRKVFDEDRVIITKTQEIAKPWNEETKRAMLGMCLVSVDAYDSGNYTHRASSKFEKCVDSTCCCTEHERIPCGFKQCECVSHFQLLRCLIDPYNCPVLRFKNIRVCSASGCVTATNYHVCSPLCDHLKTHTRQGHARVCSISGTVFEGNAFSALEHTFDPNSDDFNDKAEDEYGDAELDVSAEITPAKRKKKSTPVVTTATKDDEDPGPRKMQRVRDSGLFVADPTNWRTLNDVKTSFRDIIRKRLYSRAMGIIAKTAISLEPIIRTASLPDLANALVYYYIQLRAVLHHEQGSTSSGRSPNYAKRISVAAESADNSGVISPDNAQTSNAVTHGFAKFNYSSHKSHSRLAVDPMFCAVLNEMSLKNGCIGGYTRLFTENNMRSMKTVAGRIGIRFRAITKLQSTLKVFVESKSIRQWMPEAQPHVGVPDVASTWTDLLE